MRKSIEKLEELIVDWLRPLPRLPESFKKWFSVNLWWITLVGAIAAALGLIFMIVSLITMFLIMSGTSTYFGYFYTTSFYSGWDVFALIVSLIFMISTVVLAAMAVSPLKLGKKKGWTLLYYVLLLQTAAIVVNAVLTLSVISFVFNIIFGAICVAVGAYFLFEIRAEFDAGFSETELKAEEKAEEAKLEEK